jgi:hypothetical protein
MFSIVAIYTMMITLMPLSTAKYTRGHAQETEAERDSRYKDIAQDVFEVLNDKAEEPLFPGVDGRLRTAALLVGVARAESGFNKDVDLGLGAYSRGDSGASWCILQINIGQGRTVEGWSGKDLVKERKKCIRASLRAMRDSFKMCSYLPESRWLTAYAAGNCKSEHGQKAAKYRYWLALKALKALPPIKVASN